MDEKIQLRGFAHIAGQEVTENPGPAKLPCIEKFTLSFFNTEVTFYHMKPRVRETQIEHPYIGEVMNSNGYGLRLGVSADCITRGLGVAGFTVEVIYLEPKTFKRIATYIKVPAEGMRTDFKLNAASVRENTEMIAKGLIELRLEDSDPVGAVARGAAYVNPATGSPVHSFEDVIKIMRAVAARPPHPGAALPIDPVERHMVARIRVPKQAAPKPPK